MASARNESADDSDGGRRRGNVAQLRQSLSTALVPQLQLQAQFRDQRAPPPPPRPQPTGAGPSRTSTQTQQQRQQYLHRGQGHADMPYETGYATFSATFVSPALGGLGRMASVRTISSVDTDCTGGPDVPWRSSFHENSAVPPAAAAARRGREPGRVIGSIAEESLLDEGDAAVDSGAAWREPRAAATNVASGFDGSAPGAWSSDDGARIDPFLGLDDRFHSMGFAETTMPAPATPSRPGQPPDLRPSPPGAARQRSKSRVRSSKEVVIAIMGKTGSGKSTFISKLASQDYEHAIGHDLKSRTQQVLEVECVVDGHQVIIVDTPGFDDTNLEDGTILERIADWLRISYEGGMRLSGLVYLHDIQEVRVGRSSVKNMILFRRLTGKDSMENVVLLTSKWDAIGNPSRGVEREKQLREESGFWKEMLADGARMMRHDGTQDSAQDIIRRLLGLPPTIIRIQRQMADGMAVIDTDAGEYVNEEFLKLQQKHQEEMAALRDEMERAEEKKKIELTKTLKEHYQKLLDEVEASKAQQASLMAQKHASLERRLQSTEQELSKAQEASREAKVAANRANDNAERLARDAEELRGEISRREEADREGAEEFMSQLTSYVEEQQQQREEQLRQERQRQEREAAAARQKQLREQREQQQRESEEASLAAAVLVSTMAMAAGVMEANAVQTWTCATPWCAGVWKASRMHMVGVGYHYCRFCSRYTRFV